MCLIRLRTMLLTVELKWRKDVRMKPLATQPTPSAQSGPEKSAQCPRRMWRSTLPSLAVPRSLGSSALLQGVASLVNRFSFLVVIEDYHLQVDFARNMPSNVYLPPLLVWRWYLSMPLLTLFSKYFCTKTMINYSQWVPFIWFFYPFCAEQWTEIARLRKY